MSELLNAQVFIRDGICALDSSYQYPVQSPLIILLEIGQCSFCFIGMFPSCLDDLVAQSHKKEKNSSSSLISNSKTPFS